MKKNAIRNYDQLIHTPFISKLHLPALLVSFLLAVICWMLISGFSGNL